MVAPYTVTVLRWQDAHAALAAVRRAVFVVEQAVPEELEWEAADHAAVHVLACTADGVPIGTGRLLIDGRIGRMAVVREWRGRGVGAALLRELIATAEARGITKLHLHAQTHALPFYARFGFVPTGPEFMEAGIPHREMTRPPSS